MGWDPNPLRPWTRDHEKFIEAFAALTHALARRGAPVIDMAGWLERNYGVRLVRRLTQAQARKARRSLNAWRGGMEYAAPAREYPRLWARNRRRAEARRAASIAASTFMPPSEFSSRFGGLVDGGGLIPTDSAGNS